MAKKLTAQPAARPTPQPQPRPAQQPQQANPPAAPAPPTPPAAPAPPTPPANTQQPAPRPPFNWDGVWKWALVLVLVILTVKQCSNMGWDVRNFLMWNPNPPGPAVVATQTSAPTAIPTAAPVNKTPSGVLPEQLQGIGTHLTAYVEDLPMYVDTRKDAVPSGVVTSVIYIQVDDGVFWNRAVPDDEFSRLDIIRDGKTYNLLSTMDVIMVSGEALPQNQRCVALKVGDTIVAVAKDTKGVNAGALFAFGNVPDRTLAEFPTQ